MPTLPASGEASRWRGATVVALATLVVAERAVGCDTKMAVVTFVTGVLLGLPHGAVDHALPAWSTGRTADRATLARVAAGYGATVVAAAGLIALSPTLGLAIGLAASLWHFGTDDAEEAGVHSRGLRRVVVAAGYGVVPVLGPFAFWPTQAGQILAWLAPGLGWAAVTGAPGETAVIGLAVLAAVAAPAPRRASVAAELVVLVALVILLPPLAAFGCYFAAWHSLRHVARLLAVDPSGGDLRRRWTDLARVAWLPALAAYAGLGAAWWIVPAPDRAPVALAGLLAVAVPHSVIVARSRRTPSPTTARGGRTHPAPAASG